MLNTVSYTVINFWRFTNTLCFDDRLQMNNEPEQSSLHLIESKKLDFIF